MSRMLRGAIWFVAVFAFFFLLINAFEYYSWSSVAIRTSLFYLYLSLNAIILVKLVIIPLLKLFRIGGVISDDEAAKIIGRHFPEVQDKLINTLQLKRLSKENGTLVLLEASIEQKTKAFTLYPLQRL